MELKIMVHKEKSIVLFSEADADFVDCLFSFLALPLGTIVRLIGKKAQSHPIVVGCFNTLYMSAMNLDKQFFCTEACKDMLLHPRSSLADNCQKLKINVDDTEYKYFICSTNYHGKKCSEFARIYKNTETSNCGYSEVLISNSAVLKDQVFVNKDSKFIITNDLHVVPLIPKTAMELVNKLNIKDMNTVEERTVKLDSNQLMLDLLKWTLLSRTPLTDLFVLKSKYPEFMPKDHLPLKKRHCFEQDREVLKMKLTARIIKSDKEVLFVEAEQDFINFLFSFLTIPLGQALHILDGESCLGSIDGLYKSIQALDSQYFVSENHKNKLLRPKLATHFDCKNQLFPLEANDASLVVINGLKRTIIDPKLPSYSTTNILGGFVGSKSLFMVSDDLIVTPYSVGNLMSILNRFEISVCDLEERTVNIGIAEGLSILRASLNSTSALTNGLFHALNLKEPKQEI